MTISERNAAIAKALDARVAAARRDPAEARRALVDYGILTEAGNPKKPYRNLFR